MQDCSGLHVGLRTGFCGSLTTFASWQLFLIQILIGGKSNQGGQWAEFLWGQIVGLYLALCSFLVGKHLANDCAQIVNMTSKKRSSESQPTADEIGISRSSGRPFLNHFKVDIFRLAQQY